MRSKKSDTPVTQSPNKKDFDDEDFVVFHNVLHRVVSYSPFTITTMAKYFDVTWDENDLLQCKQALLILDEQGVPFGDIFELEQMGAFGNLDVSGVLMEIYGQECLEPCIGIGCV